MSRRQRNFPEIKTSTREVIYCPKCGWESFDPDSYEEDCQRGNCDGKMTGTYEEEYEV
jgi:hypothetical protein